MTKQQLNKKEYYLKNREVFLAKAKTNYALNKDRVKAKSTEWAKDNSNRREQIRRNSRYKKEFGITLVQYNEILAAQNYSCKGCSRHENEFKRHLHVDHCHSTMRVRGLLCGACNTALGLLKDSPMTLLNLVDYLR